MCLYARSQGKSSCCHGKREFQMFSLISGCHVGVPWRGTEGHQNGICILSSIIIIIIIWVECWATAYDILSICHSMVLN